MSTNPVSSTTSDTAGTLLHSDTKDVLERLKLQFSYALRDRERAARAVEFEAEFTCLTHVRNLSDAISTIERLEKELAEWKRTALDRDAIISSMHNAAAQVATYGTDVKALVGRTLMVGEISADCIDAPFTGLCIEVPMEQIRAFKPNLCGNQTAILLAAELTALKAGGSPHVSDGVNKDSGQRLDSTEVAAGGDGGPAFPYAFQHEDDQRFLSQGFAPGMSLRDWFAGQALAGILASYSNRDNIASPDARAEESFVSADAMLGARTRKGADKVSNVVTQSPEQAEAEDEAAWIKRWHAIGDNRDHDKAKQDFLAGRRSRGDS